MIRALQQLLRRRSAYKRWRHARRALTRHIIHEEHNSFADLRQYQRLLLDVSIAEGALVDAGGTV